LFLEKKKASKVLQNVRRGKYREPRLREASSQGERSTGRRQRGAVDGEKATAEAADKEEESAADGEEAKKKSIEAAPSAVENAEEAAVGDSADAPAVGPVKRKLDEAAAIADETGATPEKKAKMEEECTKDEV